MTDLPPEQWDTTQAPSYGTLAEVGVSYASGRSAATQWQYEVVLRHGASGSRVQVRGLDEAETLRVAWAALRDLVLEHHPHDAVAEAARHDERTINP